jgi:hypothetical protein
LREDCAHAESGEKEADPGFSHEMNMLVSISWCECWLLSVNSSVR